MTSLKTIARHLAAVTAGKIERANIIGIRKAINAMERDRDCPAKLSDAIFELEEAIAELQPEVSGELHETGLKVLRNPRYSKRWNERQRDVINDHNLKFHLIRFDRIGGGCWHSVPVYKVAGNGEEFAFRNIPWQSAWTMGEQDGPRVVPVLG